MTGVTALTKSLVGHMKNHRKRTGQAIAEFGPAVFIIIIVVLIPILDLLFLGVAYAAGWYENHLVVREVVCHDPTDGAAINTATANSTTAWQNSGLCLGLGGPTKCNVQNTVQFYIVDSVSDEILGGPVLAGSACQPHEVPPGSGDFHWVGYANVQTQITVAPFLTLPWIGPCQGINQPITFTFADQRPQEEKGLR
jgi:hypothetical protein